jgi:hypothetical protein
MVVNINLQLQIRRIYFKRIDKKIIALGFVETRRQKLENVIAVTGALTRRMQQI